MPRGGARPGAGRPPGRNKAKAEREPEEPVKRGAPSKAEQKLSPEQLVMNAITRELEVIKKTGVTADLVEQMALEGLATLRYEAKRGNVRCAMFLVKQCMGEPRRPYRERVGHMDKHELAETFRGLLAILGIPTPVADLLLARVEEAEVAQTRELAAIARPPDAGEDWQPPVEVGPLDAEPEDDDSDGWAEDDGDAE